MIDKFFNIKKRTQKEISRLKKQSWTQYFEEESLERIAKNQVFYDIRIFKAKLYVLGLIVWGLLTIWAFDQSKFNLAFFLICVYLYYLIWLNGEGVSDLEKKCQNLEETIEDLKKHRSIKSKKD